MHDYDDAELVYNLIKDQWSLDAWDMPEIRFEPEAMMVNARNGFIYISSMSQSTQIASIDYESISQTGYVSVRLSSRFREDHFRWRNEIWRILMANRRLGRPDGRLGNYTFLEVTRSHRLTDLSGWYVTVFDVRLTGYCIPIDSTGLGSF
jgi:hypothetical protein